MISTAGGFRDAGREAKSMNPHEGEVRDLPFLKNDMKEHAPTMDKPLDTADAPGKADSEFGKSEELERACGSSA